MMLLMLLSVLLLSLQENHCQRLIPYLHFRGQHLTNNSYVDLSRVSNKLSSSLQCRTDLTKCCSGTEGSFRGDWYFPNGTRLSFSEENGFYEGRGAKIVNLYRNTQATSPTGIFYCKIPYDNKNPSNETLYVGLYNTAAGMFSIAT